MTTADDLENDLVTSDGAFGGLGSIEEVLDAIGSIPVRSLVDDALESAGSLIEDVLTGADTLAGGALAGFVQAALAGSVVASGLGSIAAAPVMTAAMAANMADRVAGLMETTLSGLDSIAPGLDIASIVDDLRDKVEGVLNDVVVDGADTLSGGPDIDTLNDALSDATTSALAPVSSAVPGADVTGIAKEVASGAAAVAASTGSNVKNIPPGSASKDTSAMIHWFSRGEDVPFQLVAAKRAGVDTGVPKALADTWDEVKTQFAPIYPYNKIFMSESNHIIEIDDTPGAERLHWFHRRGNFEEWHPDGKRVLKIVDENFEILMKHDYRHVQGHGHLTTEGRYHLMTKAEYFIENIEQAIWVSHAHITITAPRIDLNP